MWLRLRITSRLGGGAGRPAEIPPRHERREAARERHHATGEPAWTPGDRHLGEPSKREVQDVTSGTPGEFGSHRVVDD
jgi:hypothetical protein